MALQQPSVDEMGRDPSAGAVSSVGTSHLPRIGSQNGRDVDLEAELLDLAKKICTGVENNDLSKRRSEWARGYRAYNNVHLETSKYRTPTYRTRSKNFVPKTRSAVKKNMVAAASALFGASDAVSVTAENDGDPAQQASAVINQELLNYRLDRTNLKAGISWFPICMGQLQTTRITGVCFSKQYWEYEERLIPASEEDMAAFMESQMAPPVSPEQGMLPPATGGGMPTPMAPSGVPPPPSLPPPEMIPPGGMPIPGTGFPPPSEPAMAEPPPMPPMPMEEMPPEMGGFSPLPSMPPMDAGGAAPPPGGDMGMMPPPEAMGMPPEGMEQPEQPPPPPPPPPPKSAMPALPPKPPTIVWGMDGQPMVVKVLRDRPRVRPCQPEHAIIDLTAPWEDVIQEGEFFIMQIPMRISQIRRMQKKGRQNMGGGQWLPVTDSELKSAVEAYSATQVKQARGRGIDPFSAGNQPSFSDYDVVWVHENFIQLDGTDMHFYSLGTTAILSVPGPTEEHYPAHKGERPYVMGLGEIEAFSPVPMSMVESIQPIQNEVNDIRNLSIDTLKQGIAPIGVYRRGADIDLRALKERGPDANIGVSNMEDLRFEKPPGPDPTSFAMHDRLTIEMDESAGSFSTSSVNNNRAVGETVGGMQLVSNAANSVQEYDLRVYVETYVERVLRQLIMLEQHYETDETVLALVGQKADVYQRFGVDEPIDDLLQRQVTLKVNAGVGSTDPFMKLQKFSSAIQMAGMVAPFVEGQVTVNAEEVYGEIFASAGYQAERFFQFTSPEEAMQAASQQPDPVQMKAEADMQMAQANVQKAEADARKTEIEGQKLQIEGARLELEYANLRDQSEERRARFGLEIDQFDRANMNADRDFEEQQRLADRDGMQNDRDFEEGRRVSDRDFAENRFASERDFAEGQRVSDRDFAEGRRTSDRDFEAEQESGGRDFGLRANAQNKQLTDEATGEAEELLTPQEAREPLPVEMAMQQGIEALMQALAQLAQSQEMQTQALAQIASGQANIDASLSTIAAAVAQRPTVERVRKGMGMKPKPDEEEPDNGS